MIEDELTFRSLQRPKRSKSDPEERNIQVGWHATNLENGVASVVDINSVARVAYSRDDSTIWPSKIDCAIMGRLAYTTQLARIIPDFEGPIRGADRWLRSTGILFNAWHRNVEKTLTSLENVINIDQKLGDLIHPLNGGVVFLTTLPETYALIELGERNLAREADTRTCETIYSCWHSNQLADGWKKEVRAGCKHFDVFECLMFYNHDETGKNKGYSQYQKVPYELNVKRPMSTRKPGMEDKEWYVWTPRLDSTTLQPSGVLPHHLERRRYYTEVQVNENGKKYHPYDDEPLTEGGIKVKIPFEPVGSLFMFWRTMHRLRTDCGWTFTPDLSLLMDAIEYYLMLAECATPMEMWSDEMQARRSRLTGIPSQLPSKPEQPNDNERIDNYKHNISMERRPHFEPLPSTSPPPPTDTSSSGHSTNDDALSCKSNDNSNISEGSDASDESNRGNKVEGINGISWSDDESEESFEDWGGTPPPHVHREVRDTLIAINSRLIELEDMEDDNWEALKSQHGLSKALSIVRREPCQSEKEIVELLAHQEELLPILFACTGDCAHRARMRGLFLPRIFDYCDLDHGPDEGISFDRDVESLDESGEVSLGASC